MNNIVIRHFHTRDSQPIAKLFYDTVHAVNAKDYTQKQIDAWAPKLSLREQEMWLGNLRARLSKNRSFVATHGETIVGFADISSDGYLDHMYIHKDYQRQGVATALLHHLEQETIQLGVREIWTEASITAKPFFEHHSYVVIQPQTVTTRGVSMVNFLMRKRK